ncbi:hypothetical protein ABZX77_50030 [Streptomyces sp. NPDC004237]|uniref:hypothetical protein n=1 Tax=Streptomyces sp. NPDC004237 TaxID=3154455 RepID=UPI0033A5A99B
MRTTDRPRRTPERRDARSDHRRILAIARQQLRDAPDTSLGSIAEAAGVARRTSTDTSPAGRRWSPT